MVLSELDALRAFPHAQMRRSVRSKVSRRPPTASLAFVGLCALQTRVGAFHAGWRAVEPGTAAGVRCQRSLSSPSALGVDLTPTARRRELCMRVLDGRRGQEPSSVSTVDGRDRNKDHGAVKRGSKRAQGPSKAQPKVLDIPPPVENGLGPFTQLRSTLSAWWEGIGEDGRSWGFKALLLAVSLVYGSNFGAVKYLDNCDVEVTLILAGRFVLAAAALSPFLLGQSDKNLKAGLEVGLWVALGYVTQAIGLQTTEASKSAFICSMSVVTVPFINAMLYNREIPMKTWMACALALSGVGLLTLHGSQGPVIGDLWSLGQPIGFGMGFVKSEQYMRERKGGPRDALGLTAMQMLSVALVSVVWACFTVTSKTADMSPLMEVHHLWALVYTGIITSAGAVMLESLVLKHVAVEETTVILSLEPLWASLFGVAFLGEHITKGGYAGGLAIILGCIMTQIDMKAAMTKIVGRKE